MGAVVMVAVAALAALPAAAHTDDTDRTLVLTSANYWVPFTYLEQDGKPSGVLVDYWSHWSEDMEIPVQFDLLDWAKSIEAVRTGAADIHMGLIRDDERSEYLDFSDPILSVSSGLFVRKSLGISTVGALRGRIVGAIAGEYAVTYMRERYPFLTILTYDNIVDLMAAVRAGSVDALKLNYSGDGRVIRAPYPELQDFVLLAPLFKRDLRAGVRKGNQVLLALVNNGIERLKKEGVAPADPHWRHIIISLSTRDVPILAFLALAVLVAVLAFVAGFLRYHLKSRTRALRLREELYSELVDNIRSAVGVYDAVDDGADFVVRDFNRAAETITGERRENILGRRISETFPPAVESGLLPIFSRVWRSGRSESVTSRFVVGGQRVVHDSHILRLSNGKVVAVFDDVTAEQQQQEVLRQAYDSLELRVTERTAALEQEVTEHRETAEALRQAKERAEVASRAKSALLANMSHELRTPLNGVIGYAEALLSEVFGPLADGRQREYLEVIGQSGRHLLDLIDDVLDVSAIEAGKLTLKEELFDIASLTQDCRRVIQPHAEGNGIALEVHSLDGLPRLRGDVRRIKQVLLNLMSNAVKFTPPGGQVTVGLAVDGDGALCMAVTDTGIGMSAADIETAMEPFGQVDDPYARRYAGTGLGLPLAKQLTEAHGGTLALASRPGEGTTATVRFPPERVVAGSMESEQP